MTMLFYQQEELAVVMGAERRIDKMLRDDELRLACECATQMPAFATLKYDDGSEMYVARKRKWNSRKHRYEYTVQLLGGEDKLSDTVDLDYLNDFDGLIAFSTIHYYELDGKCYRMDGYEVEPLMHIAYLACRAGRRGVRLVPENCNRKGAMR